MLVQHLTLTGRGLLERVYIPWWVRNASPLRPPAGHGTGYCACIRIRTHIPPSQRLLQQAHTGPMQVVVGVPCNSRF